MTGPKVPPRRLAYLIESDGPGGAEQVVAHLAEHAAERGDQVVVFTPADGEGWLAARLRGRPVAVQALPLGGPFSPTGIAALVVALDRHRCELLHTHEFGQALNGACAARLAGIPHGITMHGGVYFTERWRRRAALRTAAAMSAFLTAVSTPLAGIIRESLGLTTDRVEVVPNGVRAETPPARGARPAGLPAGATLLLAVGNLYPVKGHRHLVAALARLADRHPHLHVAIAGRGDEADALRAQAASLGVAERLHLLGLRQDIGALLAAADVVVQPSLAEGLPLAVLEAMFAHRPVIASAVGEIPIVLEGGAAGMLVPPADPDALATAIDALLRDRTRAAAMADRALARARAEYSSDRMAERYAALYDRALGRPPAA